MAARGIVLDHGGTIDVGSEPGKGAEFRVVFPSLPEVEQGTAQPAAGA